MREHHSCSMSRKYECNQGGRHRPWLLDLPTPAIRVLSVVLVCTVTRGVPGTTEKAKFQLGIED